MNEPLEPGADPRTAQIDELVSRYPPLSACRGSVEEAAELLVRCYTRGGAVLICGNGGSAADAGHIVGELMKGFLEPRRLSQATIDLLTDLDPDIGSSLVASLQRALPAVDLTAQVALTTAFINDQAGEAVFAQQVLGYANPANLLIGISTSGTSRNVVLAAFTAKALGMTAIGMTGRNGRDLSKWCDITIEVPADETAKIQELHLPVYHTLCAIVENHFFSEEKHGG